MNKLIFKLFYSKASFWIVFIILAAIFIGFAQKSQREPWLQKIPYFRGITGNPVNHVPNETAKLPEVYFCPRDDCSKALEAKINSANFSVHCAFYDLNLKNIISALSKKSVAADVKLVMESQNYEGQIKGDVRLNGDEQLMHNKFCAIDNKIVLTGSFNPTENDNTRNNNNLVVVYSGALAKNYEDEFNELWDGEFGKGSDVKNPVIYINNIKVENYFCPEDNCASHVIDLIKNAKSSIYFMSFSFTNEGIADALIRKDKMDVRGILDSQQSSNRFSQLKRLQDFGVKVIKDKNKYKMHHKVFIIDNETVATGSFNPTESADTKNDENLLVIHDKKIAAEFLKEFDILWV